MDQYVWIAVMDSKTTAICQSRDGEIFTFGEGPLPPAHINCRSTIVGYDESDNGVLPDTLADWLLDQPDGTELVGDMRSPITAQDMQDLIEAVKDAAKDGVVSAINYTEGGIEGYLRSLGELKLKPEVGSKVVYVDVAKVDALWAKTGLRIDPAPPEENFKLDRAKAFIQNLKPGEKFDVPRLGVGTEETHIGFDDGRHRFAAMRDLGYTKAPVSMDPLSITNARARGLLVTKGDA